MPASPWSAMIRPSGIEPRPDQSFSTTPTLLLGMYRTPDTATSVKNATSTKIAIGTSQASDPRPPTCWATGMTTQDSNGENMGVNPSKARTPGPAFATVGRPTRPSFRVLSHDRPQYPGQSGVTRRDRRRPTSPRKPHPAHPGPIRADHPSGIDGPNPAYPESVLK